jgi:3-oxoacyl-[acyl-carrier protein] reductase
LHGKIAVVTGAARGIGRAIALELATAGADVLVHTRARRDDAERTATAARGLGRASHVELCDLADPAATVQFAERAWSWRDGVDIWVNNAGADVLTGDAAGWAFDEKLAQLTRATLEGRRPGDHPAGAADRPADETARRQHRQRHDPERILGSGRVRDGRG